MTFMAVVVCVWVCVLCRSDRREEHSDPLQPVAYFVLDDDWSVIHLSLLAALVGAILSFQNVLEIRINVRLLSFSCTLADPGGGGNPAMPPSSHMLWPIRSHFSLKQRVNVIKIIKKTLNI